MPTSTRNAITPNVWGLCQGRCGHRPLPQIAGITKKIENVISFGRSKPLPYGNVCAIHSGSKGTMWASSPTGKVAGITKKIADVIFFGRSEPLPYGNVYVIYIGSKGTMWASSPTGEKQICTCRLAPTRAANTRQTQNTPTVHTVGVLCIFVIRNINYIYFL